MNLKQLIKLSWLELVRFKSVSIFLILNLTLGLIGFFLLQIFQQSLTAQSAEKAQVVLGGDVSVNARRTFTDEERQKWESQFIFTEKSRFYGLFAMMRARELSRLTSVGVFDEKFPLYGEFKFSNDPLTSDQPRVWVDPEVQETLNLKLGDQVEIGDLHFKFAGTIVEDPTRLFRGVGFAPRVLISEKYLQATQLIKPGSTFNEFWSYKIAPGQKLDDIKRQLEKTITDPIVNIKTAESSADDSNRVLKYFSDYLGLVALVALGLCFLCGTYLLQWTFLTKKKSIAIYKTLGLDNSKIIFIYVLQNLLISMAACALSYALVYTIQPGLQKLLLTEFNLPLQLVFGWQAALTTALIAILGPLLMAVPQIIQITDLRPLLLLQNVQVGARRSWAYALWLIISIVLFWTLSVWQSHSFKIASIFTVALVGLVILFRIMSRVLMFLLEKQSGRLGWLSRYAVRGLTRKPASVALVFTTMSLATMVLSLLPHVKTSIINEIKPQDTSKIPSLFMFDIQPEQVAGIRELAAETLQQELTFSPLVRSRILKINDVAYERSVNASEIQTREQDEEARFRNRGVNLTYRKELQESESITKGSFEPEYKTGAELPKISIESDYAGRVNMKIGDVITFDVQGVEVKAVVSSLRSVRWTSFQPNFFILFPDGVLNEAPQIFLTSVHKTNEAQVKIFQQKVIEKYNNLSIIDITKTIEGSLKYIDQMALGLQFMAWLAVLVGLFVFVVLLNTQIRERLQEMNLLQILGAPIASVVRIVVYQFVLLMSLSIVFGVLLGLAMAWFMISYFFKVGTYFDWPYIVLLLVVLIPVCAAALMAGLRPLKSLNPMELIRANS